ncbi:MAG TPA: hypothetical protein VF719_12990 [Abditibacteriaceae bacterium]
MTAPSQPAKEHDESAILRTFRLPIWGVEWIDEPVYYISDRPLWRLSYMKSEHFLERDWSPGFAGLLRGERSGLLKFAADRKGFVAPHKGAALLAWNENGQNILGNNGDDFSIVSFYAPYDGRYAISLRAARARFSGSTRHLGLNVAAYHGTKLASSSLIYVERTPEKNGAVEEEVTVELRAGEEIGFVADANTNGKTDNSAWENFQTGVQYLGPIKAKR